MAIWPFNRRNKNIDQVPAEVQEYYEAERRERAGIAWLLALGTLVITLVIAIGLFFGGRWVYRKVVKRPANRPTTSNVAQAPGRNDSQEENKSENNNDSSNSNTQPTANSQNPTAPSTPSAAAPPQTSSTSTSTPSTSTPNTQPAANSQTSAGSSLPNSGPGEVAGIVASTVVAGTTAHYLVISRRQRQ